MLPIDRSWLLDRRAQLRDDSSTSAEEKERTSKEITTATARLYEYEAGSWENFKSNFEDEEVAPDLPTLKLYFEWLALTIRGKLDARPSITTLTWRAGRFAYAYKNKYGKGIPEDVSEDLVSYIKNELKDRLNLTDRSYQRNFATHQDVSDLLDFLWKEDAHSFNTERLRLQLAIYIGILADTGARPGSFTRSECYREKDDSLTYKDVDVWAIRKRDGAISFRLDITFENMKGARLTDKFLKLSVAENENLSSSTVFLFLVHAWMDGAFENITSLHQLFHLETLLPAGKAGIQLPFKASIHSTPVLCQIAHRGSRQLSSTRPWSSNSALNQLKGLSWRGGWPQRMTAYNIRRGVLNKLDGNPDVSTAQRNQIAGHGNSAVFTKNYLSQHSAVAVSKIFKGRGSRLQEQNQQDEDDVRGMRLLRDDKAPQTLPPDMWEHVKLKDRELQGIEKDRECIRNRMVSMAPASGDRPAMTEARKQLESLSKDFTRRAQKLKAVALAKHREEWFKTRSSSILLGQSELQGHNHVMINDFSSSRIAIIEALYPAGDIQPSAFSAAKALVAFIAKSEIGTAHRKRKRDTTMDANQAQKRMHHSVVPIQTTAFVDQAQKLGVMLGLH